MISQSAEEKEISWEDVFAFLSQKKSTIEKNKPFSKVAPEDIDYLIEKLKGVYKRDKLFSLMKDFSP